MPVSRANVEATKAFIRARLGDPYVYGGALSPTNVKQGTDCSEVCQTALEMALGRYVPGRQAEGATTESYRPVKIGEVGPFGTIRVARPQDIPANAAAKVALHHGPGGGANSHMWMELDGMRIESRGGGVGLITQPRAMAINDPYATAWCYLPGPIVEDGTPMAPEVVTLGQAYENAGERVRQLQLALNAFGAGLDVDGEFGPRTEAAVMAYQRSNGLEADGIAGPLTLAKLGLTFGGTGTPVVTAPADAVALLRRVMTPTEVSNAVLGGYLPYLAEATRAAQINTVRRCAAWYSQLGHESSGLKYMAEIQTNGPGWSDDRRIYRGRGPIQLTWSSNYRKFGQWCAANGYVTDPELFVKQPTLVEQPKWGFLAASWYWLNAGPRPGQINSFADAGDILAVSRCVNGWVDGEMPIGWDDRRTRYLNCMAVGDQMLALAQPATSTDPIEELLMANLEFDSWSLFATPGEPKVPLVNMVRAIDAYIHKVSVSDDAKGGDADALFRIWRAVIGQGRFTDAANVARARAILIDLATESPEVVAFLAAKAAAGDATAKAVLTDVATANPAAVQAFINAQKGA